MAWNESDNQLVREFTFRDFKQAFSFMEEIARYAEQVNHHPTWTNTYNHVKISLSTHDAGNVVTDKDRHMAAYIDQVYSRYVE